MITFLLVFLSCLQPNYVEPSREYPVSYVGIVEYVDYIPPYKKTIVIDIPGDEPLIFTTNIPESYYVGIYEVDHKVTHRYYIGNYRNRVARHIMSGDKVVVTKPGFNWWEKVKIEKVKQKWKLP